MRGKDSQNSFPSYWRSDPHDWFHRLPQLWKDLDLTPSTPNAQPTAVLIIGLIKLIHVRNDIFVGPDDPSVVNDGARPYTIDATKFRAVSRMGGITYGRIGDGFEIPRAKWEDAKQVYADKAP